MSTVRETNNLIMKRLDSLEKTSEEIKVCVKSNSEKLDRIHPQNYLPAIPRPKQGVGIGRTSSIATFLRSEIKALNAVKKDSEARYIEFPEDVSDKQVNTDALNCLEIILMFHLDFHYGRMSWEKVTKKMPRVAATIYREARTTPELAVFAQTAALWAIDLLLAAKMKSRMRSIRDVEEEPVEEVNIPDIRVDDHVAVSAVPEINDSCATRVNEENINCGVSGGVASPHVCTGEVTQPVIPEQLQSPAPRERNNQEQRRGAKRTRGGGRTRNVRGRK